MRSMSASLLAVYRFDNAALEIRREAFVQPEVAPGRIGDEVAGPGVRELMGDERNQRLVSDDHRRRRKRHSRVLHAPKRERRRQHEQVVAAPAVRTVKRLRRLDHLFGVFELLRCGRGNAPVRPIPRFDRSSDVKRQIADGDRDEIRGNRLRHVKAEHAAAVLPGPASAAITATRSFGTRIVASYVMRTPGVSCKGMNDRA